MGHSASAECVLTLVEDCLALGLRGEVVTARPVVLTVVKGSHERSEQIGHRGEDDVSAVRQTRRHQASWAKNFGHATLPLQLVLGVIGREFVLYCSARIPVEEPVAMPLFIVNESSLS